MKKTVLSVTTLLALATAVFAHSDAFKPTFVDTLVSPYLDIQRALASDDLDAAKTGVAAFLAAMKSAPIESEAQETTETLTHTGSTIAEASDIKSARVAFLNLSVELETLIKKVGIESGKALFVVHCPMAFDGKGGDWIQSDKSVLNPYYGSMMLHCGKVKSQITGEQSPE